MTCDDYLALLETLPVEELTHGEAREHAAVCRDCNRVTRVVAERERNMVMAYGDVVPSAMPGEVAMAAITTARRRRVALLYRIGLGVAAAATLAFVGMSRVVPSRNSVFVRQRFAMRCLSAARAERLLRSNIPDLRHSTIRVYEPAGVLEVNTNGETMRAVRAILDQRDGDCIVAVPKAR